MGVYVYTLRKNTVKAIDMDIGAPVEIGITKYAYKCSYRYDNGAYNRLVAKQHAAAERARDANPNLVLVTMGDPKDHDFDRDGPMFVHRVEPTMEYFHDTAAPGETVGRLVKDGKKFKFVRLAA